MVSPTPQLVTVAYGCPVGFQRTDLQSSWSFLFLLNGNTQITSATANHVT